ncbi:MAG: hypothetical protein ACHQE6_03045 [Solirubrobacterales bacterium]
MSTVRPGLSTPLGGAHPAVLSRRAGELLLIALTGIVPLAVALAVAVEVPNPNLLLVGGLILGALGVFALIVNTRLEVSVALLALYLGLLEGPVKLLSASQAASPVRDVLISAVCLGTLARLLVSRERVRLPPLSGWVILFGALVLAEAFNPHTLGVLKILGGFRQQLEWVPFFFFGYLLMRSRERFRQLFVILGVIALANGAVSTYQTRLSPAQLASWGPGYAELVNGNATLTARRYLSEGVARVRPPALGTDAGFGGSVGVIALAGTVALLATGRRRRWFAVLLCLGALLAIATSLARLSVVGAALALFCFVLLSASAGRRVTRPLGALLAVAALALPLGAVLVSAEGSSVFSRYTSIAPSNVTSTSTTYKAASLAQIPNDIVNAPFGFGLATAGAASSFGGRSTVTLEGHGHSSETQYNYLMDELGLPGLLLWVGLSAYVTALVVRRLARVEDLDIRIGLAAMFATFIAMLLMGTNGPVTASAAAGPFFWFAVGTAAYWLAGQGRTAAAQPTVAR